eukprot:scaffold7222_cov535-Prasinococcus_capsulatus_cf.AAC.6
MPKPCASFASWFLGSGGRCGSMLAVTMWSQGFSLGAHGLRAPVDRGLIECSLRARGWFTTTILDSVLTLDI